MSAPISAPGLRSRLADLLYRAANAVVFTSAGLTTRDRRADWRREWRAELWHRRDFLTRHEAWTPWHGAGLLLRSFGTIPHALWTRAHEWSLDMLLQDIRYAIRTLLKAPGFTLVTLLTLALGIGANTAIFSVVDAVILRPLAFEESGRLAMVWGYDTRRATRGSFNQSFPDYADYRDQNDVFEDLAAWTLMQPRLTGDEGEPLRLQMAVVSHNLLDVLRVQPELGRDFVGQDDEPGATPTVLISHGFWQSRFAGNPDVIGDEILLDGTLHTVIGVLPRSYGGGSFAGRALPPTAAQVWVAMEPALADTVQYRGVHNLLVVGRLHDDVGIEQANVDIAAIASRLEELYPEDNLDIGGWVQPVHTALVGNFRPLLTLLFGAVGFVLLIACSNVANLLLSRATSRRQEIAVRMALGAKRSRLVRQMLTESMLLALGGGLLGLVIAWLGTSSLVALSPVPIPRIDTMGVDGRVLGFMLAASVMTGLLFGLLPARQASRTDLQAALGAGGRGSGDGHNQRLRKGLVVTEVALAVILVVGAGLLLRSFRGLQQVDLGFDATDTLVVDVQMPIGFVTPEWRRSVEFFERATERIRALPGIETVTAAFANPLDANWTSSFSVVGQPDPAPGNDPEANFRPVHPGYFETMGIPLLSGREFNASDDSTNPGVVIINRALARDFFADQDPIGQQLSKNHWWQELDGTWEIVGVVENVRFAGPARSAQWATYFPHAQMPANRMSILVRTSGEPLATSDAVRAAIHEVDSDMPLPAFTTMDRLQANSVASPRFNTVLLGLFALLALTLAAIGIYGVLSYSVVQRSREIGIRMALGAEQGSVVGLVLRQGLGLTLIGIVIGLLAAAGLSTLIQSFIVGISSTDPLTFGAVAVFLLGVAALASVVPAWRASRVDPVVALQDN